MLEVFGEVPFLDEAAAEKALEAIPECSRPDLASSLARGLEECGGPDTALMHLTRFLEAIPDREAELRALSTEPEYTRLLLEVLSQGHYLTDIVCRSPGFVRWLWQEGDLEGSRSKEALAGEIRESLNETPSLETRCSVMRRLKQREILRIAAREVFGHASLRAVTQDLSTLADVMVEAGVQVAMEDLVPRFGRPLRVSREDTGGTNGSTEATFCVLAMGKLGGEELNFSSDIDLIFIFSDDGETSGGSSGILDNPSFFQRLGERIVKVISEDTEEGNVFRVDMRLRPYGRFGPLAVVLDVAVAYYENEGQAWERQALLKARPIAGDLALGKQFLERTRPFVYPRFFDDETLEDIHHVKQQMEAQVQQKGLTETEVKLGRGGIRDVEFTVQILQLLNGGRLPELQVRSTLDAIAELGHKAILSAFEANSLASNYTFMRRVEHRLQIRGGQQVHALPRNPAELDRLARQLGYVNAEAFVRDYRARAETTRQILRRFLAVEGSGNRWLNDLFHPQDEGEIAMARLGTMGFVQAERARDELVELYSGPRDRPNSLHVRQRFTNLLPSLLRAVSMCGDPDHALMHLARVLGRIHAPGAMYDILSLSPHLCEYLVGLVDNSEYLTNILVQDPGLLDTLASPEAIEAPSTREELMEALAGLSAAYEPEAAPYRLHAGETLRIGVRELFRGTDVFEVGRELSLLAEVCLDYALGVARGQVAERYGVVEGACGVLGLGKLGGRELGYGSDLDLVFVYDQDARVESGMAPAEYFAAVASRTFNALKERTRYGVLYDVDARLRPDGKKGMLAVSDARLSAYFEGEAQAWERLALLKARPVAGDSAFCSGLAEWVQRAGFSRPFSIEEVEQIADLRERMAKEASALDLKKGSGGLIEIEFLTRILQVRFSADLPELACGDVRGAIEGLRRHGHMAEEEATDLLDAYCLFRRIENRIRMAGGTSGSSLPVDEAERVRLARRLGLLGDIVAVVDEAKAHVRRVYEQVLGLSAS